jgi:Ca-activated chloride channel family protein
MHPNPLPDLFKGSEILVLGTTDARGSHEMKLSGAVGEHRETFRFTADLDGSLRNAFIPRMWAATRVAYLQEQVALHGKNPELVDEIRRLGREYGILTPFTSFLIVEEGVAQEQLREARQAFGVAADSSLGTETGKAAVDRSVRLGRMKSEGAMMGGTAPAAAPQILAEDEALSRAFDVAGVRAEAVQDLVRPVHDKTFYFRRADGVWYDSLIPKGTSPEIAETVEAWSDEFFVLVRQHPELRRYALLDADMVVMVGGKAIRITMPKE